MTGPARKLSNRLREETRDLHEALEADLDWRRRMATPEGYARLLRRWWGFHATYEPMVTADPPLPGHATAGRLGLVESDLLFLGHAPADIAGLPRIDAAALPADRAGMAGAAYVIEGSALGGQVIARHVRRVLGPAVSEGAYAYFGLRDEAGAAMGWLGFREALDALDPNGHDAAVAGARLAFAALGRWLPG